MQLGAGNVRKSIKLNKTTRMAPSRMMAALLVMMVLMVKAQEGRFNNCKFNPIPPVPLAPQTLDGVRYNLYTYTESKPPEIPGLALTKRTFKYKDSSKGIDVTKTSIFNDGKCETSGLTIKTSQASCGVLFARETVHQYGNEITYTYNIYNIYADGKWWLQHTQAKVAGNIISSRTFIELSSTDPKLTLADLPSRAKQMLGIFCGWAGDPPPLFQHTTQNLTAVCSK